MRVDPKENTIATPFAVELEVPESPRDAQARAVTALVDPARALGLKLADRGATELSYRPRTRFPLLLTLWHHLNRERMAVRFTANPSGGTVVEIQGAVARGNHELATDHERWREALGRR